MRNGSGKDPAPGSIASWVGVYQALVRRGLPEYCAGMLCDAGGGPTQKQKGGNRRESRSGEESPRAAQSGFDILAA